MQIAAQIGIDIGGSHISGGIVYHKQKKTLSIESKPLNSFGTAYKIIETIAGMIQNLITQEPGITQIGIAFPGPFDYNKGVNRIAGVGGKFSKMYGLHVGQSLNNMIRDQQLNISFFNDAHCFAIGTKLNYALKGERSLFITLGTGLGSAYMIDDIMVADDELLPDYGYLYKRPFLSGIAEDFISARWFLGRYKSLTGNDIKNVEELAAKNSAESIQIFHEFGNNLGKFLSPVIKHFECKELVIGGNISKSKSLFTTSFEKQLGDELAGLHILYTDETEECIVTGAAALATKKTILEENMDPSKKRKTTQGVLPVYKSDLQTNKYELFPTHHTSAMVYAGFDQLAEEISRQKKVIIDGYGGMYWEVLREQLQNASSLIGKNIFWYDIDSCARSSADIALMLKDHLNGDDPVFGKKYNGELSDFFDEQKLGMLIADKDADISIIYGTGASLSKWEGLLIYADVPKNEIQYRMRTGQITNLGAEKTSSNTQTYKRFYFVDWPVLNKHKEKLLPKIDCIIDAQRLTEITWMKGNDFRDTLKDISLHAIRARPWFEAGIWGGQWMKQHFEGLNKDEINYAWSFELITPENGIVIEGNNTLLEVSFDFLLFNNNISILGKAAKRFGNEFPIRFDFLDTFHGGNLSVQCHPRTKYIQDNFGETFTQDETYYILDCANDAKVYLGFQDNIDAVCLKNALIDAQERSIPVEIENFVQVHDAKKHDLFLIPNGTVHASGKNNMVLEISNTPYIFTFKMYDWLRTDLNGLPRPINIEHAFKNLYFDRKGDYVPAKLISHPVVETSWEDGRKIVLPTHEQHFYAIDRYEFDGQISIALNDQCHCCMLVEGQSIEVSTGNKKDVFQYAETFIIPASVKQYQVRNTGNAKAFLVVAYVKNDHC